MQDTSLELPTKMKISGCYQVKSIKKEIKYTLNLSILGPNGNACPMRCGKVVVKEGPFSAKLDIVKIEPKIKDPVWNSFWFSVKIVTDMTAVTIDKNGQPILTDDDLINGDLLSKDSPTILTEKNYNSIIVVVVSLVKIIDSVPVVPVVWNNSDGNYATITYTRIRRSEIKTSLMLHIVKNDKNFKEIARNILYPTQDSASDSASNAKEIKEDAKEIKEDANDAEDMEEDADDADEDSDADDADEDSDADEDADDSDDDADDAEDMMEDSDVDDVDEDSDDADDMEDNSNNIEEDEENMDNKDPKQRSCCKD